MEYQNEGYFQVRSIAATIFTYTEIALFVILLMYTFYLCQRKKTAAFKMHPPKILEICLICLEKIECEVQSNCGHLFCAKCISKLWESQQMKQLECPHCHSLCYLFVQNVKDGQMLNSGVYRQITQYNRLYSGLDDSFKAKFKGIFPIVFKIFFKSLILLLVISLFILPEMIVFLIPILYVLGCVVSIVEGCCGSYGENFCLYVISTLGFLFIVLLSVSLPFEKVLKNQNN